MLKGFRYSKNVDILIKVFKRQRDSLAIVAMLAVGYGDIYAVSVIGKVITMISSLFGIAIVALPAGIITAGYMEEIGQKE